MTSIVAVAEGETITVYQQCVEENHYLDENGIYVHEYVWDDPAGGFDNGMISTYGIEDAEWTSHTLSNGTVVNHRGAKEYTTDGTKWGAHAQTSAYNHTVAMYNQTTARIVNVIFGTVSYEAQSQWLRGYSEAETTKSALSNEDLLGMRSYWSTEYNG